MEGIIVRHIEPRDNAAMALIIRNALSEFGANKPGTVYYDDSTDHLYELFLAAPLSEYFVAEKDGVLIGGAGIYPTDALPAGTCELVKMYLSPAARGLGLGRSMINRCMEAAKAKGFQQIYLETMPELKKAVSVYEKFGFTYLPGPMGNSGHNGCDIWMIRKL
ncbi:GNAT family N-acetyltransferase [Sediminibacterium sp.]|uniref:GNAT family N-acetyltransferase n=1 Tax=Sediminibacterium sp. TaxID=1917865 RepID=UPI0025EB5C5B|nr:GNAT family N-acetyltransferase [Sediminibacterium sp.]MBW0178269.1 GNAT family N-acetyltransferase [Sediminibacterium sp.]